MLNAGLSLITASTVFGQQIRSLFNLFILNQFDLRFILSHWGLIDRDGAFLQSKWLGHGEGPC